MTKSNISYVMVFRGEDGDIYYDTRSANHKVLDVSQGYSRHEDALRAVKAAYPDVKVKDVTADGC